MTFTDGLTFYDLLWRLKLCWKHNLETSLLTWKHRYELRNNLEILLAWKHCFELGNSTINLETQWLIWNVILFPA